jgi:hypothetical protein
MLVLDVLSSYKLQFLYKRIIRHFRRYASLCGYIYIYLYRVLQEARFLGFLKLFTPCILKQYFQLRCELNVPTVRAVTVTSL